MAALLQTCLSWFNLFQTDYRLANDFVQFICSPESLRFNMNKIYKLPIRQKSEMF